MKKLEIIFNLWYVFDEDDGLIYSLRAKPYAQDGDDEQRLKFLQSRAQKDYLIAQPFPISDSYSMNIMEGCREKKMPVFPVNQLDMYGGPVKTVDLYEEVFRKIEKQLPAQTKLKISQNPLICTTPLLGDNAGNLEPKIDGQFRFD